MPINPMSFVTPYTAVGTGHRGGGASFANSINQAKQQKVSEGYLQNAQRQQSQNELRFGQKEVDQARERLDGALMSGNSDAVELAANNLRAVAQRYGFSLTETRSDAQLKSSVKTPVGKQEAQGTEGNPFDADSPEFKAEAAKEVPTDGSDDAVNAEADKRIDAQLAPSPFTGGVPGGSLPQMGNAATASESSPVRPPGGSLPASPVAEPPGTSEAPLRGYTLTGADGKPLYSVAPKDIEGRQRQRVGDVFEGLASKTQDPQEHQWLAQAKAETEKLIGTMPMDEAVKIGLGFYLDRMKARDNLSVVEANRKPRWGGGSVPASGGYATGKEGQAQRAMTDDAWTAIQNTMGNFDIKGLNKTDNGLANAQAGLTSANPASQRGAVRNILKAMSGLTVNAKEEAGYAQLAGIAEQAKNMLSQLTGDEMSPEYVAAVKQMLNEWRAESQKIRSDAGRRAAEAYVGLSPQAPEDVVQDQADTIYRYFVGGSAGGKAKYSPPEERAKGAGAPKKSVKDLE